MKNTLLFLHYRKFSQSKQTGTYYVFLLMCFLLLFLTSGAVVDDEAASA